MFDYMYYPNLDSLTPQESALVEQNLGLVREIMRPRQRIIEYTKGVYDEEDWFSVGVLALCAAAKKFNPDLGRQFSTYAWVVVNNQFNRLKKYIDTRGIIREEGADNSLLDSDNDGGATFLDMIEEPSSLTEEQLVIRVMVREAYKELNPDEKKFVYLNVVEGKPLRLIEEEYGVGRMKVHNIVKQGLSKMREVLQ